MAIGVGWYQRVPGSPLGSGGSLADGLTICYVRYNLQEKSTVSNKKIFWGTILSFGTFLC